MITPEESQRLASIQAELSRLTSAASSDDNQLLVDMAAITSRAAVDCSSSVSTRNDAILNNDDDQRRNLPSFTTESKPLLSAASLGHADLGALRMLFLGDLLPRLLKMGGPSMVSQLRSVSDCRRAMDQLPDDAKRDLGLPVIPTEGGLDLDTAMEHLRPVLTTSVAMTSEIGTHLQTPYWTLNRVGFLALAGSPLTSERALLSMIQPKCTPSSRWLLLAIAKNQGASSSVLTKVFDTTMKHKVPRKKVVSLVKAHLTEIEVLDVLEELSQHPNTTGEVLSKILAVDLMESSDANLLGIDTRRKSKIFWKIGQHPNTSTKLLLAGMQISSPTHADLFGGVDTEGHDGLRERFMDGVVRRKDIEKDGLALLLLSHVSESVRVGLARNKNVCAETLKELAKDPSRKVRIAVANNPNTDDETLETLISGSGQHRLIFEGEDDETYLLVESWGEGTHRGRACIDRVFSIGAGLGHRTVLAMYSADPNIITDLVGMDGGSHISSIAGNACAPPELLASLAQSSCEFARASAARNTNTPAQTLRVLSEDDDFDVIDAVANNESTSPDTLVQMLSNTTDADLRSTILWNRNLPLATFLDEIKKDIEEGNDCAGPISHREDEMQVETLSAALRCPNASKEYFVTNPRIPIQDLARLCTDFNLAMPSAYVGKRTHENPWVQLVMDKLSLNLSRDGFASLSS